jgi:nicotinate-nucleotide adenylyltransferase
MKKIIGIYGGAFNPIHLGHLNLAAEMMEAHHLHEVWFCPTGCHPQKHDPFAVSAEHRLNMIRLAIEGQPRFQVSDIEIDREGPSYTVDTLLAFNELEKEKKDPYAFALILGEDAARGFSTWHQPEEIIKLARLLVGRRGDEKKRTDPFPGSPEIAAAIQKGWTQTRVMEISSREVRERVLKKKYCAHLLPTKVLDYINTNQLYCSSLKEVRFL